MKEVVGKNANLNSPDIHGKDRHEKCKLKHIVNDKGDGGELTKFFHSLETSSGANSQYGQLC
jgi:hypothetical protein